MAEQTRDEPPSGDRPLGPAAEVMASLMRLQGEAMGALLAPLEPMIEAGKADSDDAMAQWTEAMTRLPQLWWELGAQQAEAALAGIGDAGGERAWPKELEAFYRDLRGPLPDAQAKLWDDAVALWQGVLGQYVGGKADTVELPRKDRRFDDPRWRESPFFALVHQAYLLMSEQVLALADGIEGLPPERQEQLRFAARTMLDAMSPANFPLTNPVVVDRIVETGGDNIVKGMEHLVADLQRGQLTHTDQTRFTLGENIAITPGKVVHRTPLLELIQYSPTTKQVGAIPVVIFPPWINRFYILDLNPKKSFVRWAVDQGLTVFIASWRSADASMADVDWDDYVRAQINAIDFVRTRLDVPAVHAIGYCVAGTTLAATLAILARRGEEDKAASATFFTAQVDFEKAGDLKNFVDDQQIEALSQLAKDGFLDGRYLAATFNLLRGRELIWNYVVNNYLLGEEYPAFDLLHWNGDVTNLPAKWHRGYLEQLYRDNLLVKADALTVDGTPVDLTKIATPLYIQAGKEDHIAPAESVFRILRHVSGPARFVLAGSGHIAGVVNPPEAQRYQYWTNDKPGQSLAEFIAGATEHAGSWWPDWAQWLRAIDGRTVRVDGPRDPGSKGDKVMGDAPGEYVRVR